jgi:cyclopropane fatty-acyl-phospholipid synthase-like methyltransferase
VSQKDKERWNKRYKSSPIMPNKAVKILRDYAPLSQGKEALDIACGRGRHAKYLAEYGFRVEALDISSVALKELENIEGIIPKEVDLDSYELEENRYDLIVCVNYLDRKLFPKIYKALKNNGLFIFQTFIYHPDNTKAPSNRDFLLEQGELRETFEKEYEILYLREYWDRVVSGDKLMCGAFVGRKVIKL